MAKLTYPTTGRGAWNVHGIGGTLDADGASAGMYYRAPADGSHMAMPGYVAYKVLNAGAAVDVNYFAVLMAVQAIQREIGAQVDGLFGSQTTARLKTWQAEKRLTPDGVFGPVSAEVMFRSLARSIARTVTANSMVQRLVPAHCTVESGWDPGAVGVSTPHDLGVGQINGDAHPELDATYRLTPRLALSSITRFVLENSIGMNYVERDTIAAYNLGLSGARGWVKDGRPAVWHGAPIGSYVADVKAAEVG